MEENDLVKTAPPFHGRRPSGCRLPSYPKVPVDDDGSETTVGVTTRRPSLEPDLPTVKAVTAGDRTRQHPGE